MYYRLRPPPHIYGRRLKVWYRRLCGYDNLPINWYECPPVWVEEKLLPTAISILHLPSTWSLSAPSPSMSLKTYRP